MNNIITPSAISGFPEHLPEVRIVEQKLLDTIRNNYELAGFSPIETSAVERIEVLTSKWADDREIYTVGRLHEEWNKEAELWLHFDLTVPMARYVAQNYEQLTFPFRRYQIQKVWRWERAQSGRYREFYQADIDIIGDGELSIGADVEILTTIDNVLSDLNIGSYQIHLNNKKIIQWFVESLQIVNPSDIFAITRIIDKVPKVGENETRVSLVQYLSEEKIERVLQFCKIAKMGNEAVLEFLSSIDHPLVAEWLMELRQVYIQSQQLGMNPNKIILDPGIARGLGYYTGTIYETFLVGHEWLGSICSGGRYENLASYFTEKKLPGVGVSIGVSRLLSRLLTLEKFNTTAQTSSKVLVTRLQEEYSAIYLKILWELRKANIPSEFYLQENEKIGKQLGYANKKWIPYTIIAGDDELSKNEVQLKHMHTGDKEQIPLNNIVNHVQSLLNKS